MRYQSFAPVVIYLLSPIAAFAAPEFEGVINDIVTKRIVTIRVTRGKLTAGKLATVLYRGKSVAVLRVKSANGICRVVKGSVREGAKVVHFEEAKPEDRQTAAKPKGELPPPKIPDDPDLKAILEIEGGLRAFRELNRKAEPELAKTIAKIRQARLAMQSKSSRQRIIASLHQAGRADIASQIGKAERTLDSPIFPNIIRRLQTHPYGTCQFICESPTHWALPQFWGKKPLPPVLSGWEFSDNACSAVAPAEALVRRDLVIDDGELRGSLQIKKGSFAYLVLRSQIVVKFHAGRSTSGVTLKVGYDNLSTNTVLSKAPILSLDKIYRFSARLVGRQLTVKLDDKEVLSTSVEVDPSTGSKIPTTGYWGMGVSGASCTFANMTLEGLSHRAREAMPLIARKTEYEKFGDAKRILELDADEFIALSGRGVRRHRRIHHQVKSGTLLMKGSPYSQFSAKCMKADDFDIKGKVRLLEAGNAWFRVNSSMYIGISAFPRNQELEEDEHVYFVKHSSGNFNNYDDGFAGTPLLINQWYDFQLSYRHPVARLALGGRTVVTTQTRAEKGQEADNHFGISAYNIKAELKGLEFQAMKAKNSASVSESELAQIREKSLAQLKRLSAALATRTGSKKIAGELLTGKRQLIALPEEFRDLAESYRDAHNWQLYLRLLQANYERLPEGNLREKEQAAWRLAQQKYDFALEATELGELGLDNIIRLRNEAASSTPATGAGFWVFMPKAKKLQLLDVDQREATRQFSVNLEIGKLVERGDYLMTYTRDGKTIARIDAKTGKATTFSVPSGTVLDLVSHPHQPISYVSVNENHKQQLALRRFVVYILDEKNLTLKPSGAHGMRLAIDPHGRFLFTSFSFPMAMPVPWYDPSPFMAIPVRGHVDHLVGYEIKADRLSVLTDRRNPGIGGHQIQVDPTGRILCYVAERGFHADRRKELLGKRVPGFRVPRVESTVNSFNAGGQPRLLAFNPRVAEVYIYNGQQIRVFNTKDFLQKRSIPLPIRIKPMSATGMWVSADGKSLLLAYRGKPCGLYVHPLGRADGQTYASADELMARIRELQEGGREKEAIDKLREFVRAYRFSAEGERAATELISLTTPTVSVNRLPILSIDDLRKQPLPQPKSGRTTPVQKVENRSEGYGEAMENLRSFASLGKRYPNCWRTLWKEAESKYPGDLQLRLIAAEQAELLKDKEDLTRLAFILLSQSKGKGWYAMKAYAILARVAKANENLLAWLHALHKSLEIAPNNPFVHRQLGDACKEAKLDERSTYHYKRSLEIYPSQPGLRKNLLAAKAIKPLEMSERSIEELYDTIAPSVALIRQRMGVGSGFFITKDGLLLTNHHVIAGSEDALKIQILGRNKRESHELKATLVASNARLDIALLAVELGDLDVAPTLLAPEGSARTGMKVIAIGNPGMGTQVLTRTVTEGIISNVRQSVAGQDYIQTSAAVNPGNSGGPLLDRRGYIIGMVTLKARLDNVGFAVPVNRLQAFLKKHLD